MFGEKRTSVTLEDFEWFQILDGLKLAEAAEDYIVYESDDEENRFTTIYYNIVEQLEQSGGGPVYLKGEPVGR